MSLHAFVRGLQQDGLLQWRASFYTACIGSLLPRLDVRKHILEREISRSAAALSLSVGCIAVGDDSIYEPSNRSLGTDLDNIVVLVL